MVPLLGATKGPVRARLAARAAWIVRQALSVEAMISLRACEFNALGDLVVGVSVMLVSV